MKSTDKERKGITKSLVEACDDVVNPKMVTEKMNDEQTLELHDLIDDLLAVTPPYSYWDDEHFGYSMEREDWPTPEEIRKKMEALPNGKEIAKTVFNGLPKMAGHQKRYKRQQADSPYRWSRAISDKDITKAGKAKKNWVKNLKKDIKRRLKNKGVNLPE